VEIEVVLGDITTQDVDVVVNAANSSLLGGGGVDGAIHRAAGPDLVHACRLLGGCMTGDAKITRGFRLPARWIVHTVGPVWRGGSHGEPDLLASCYRRSLEEAVKVGAQTIAFPSISTGIFGYPIDLATEIAIVTMRAFGGDLSGRLVAFSSSDFGTIEHLVLSTCKTERATIEAFCRAALAWAAGGLGKPLVDAAANALAEGLDSPSLRMLAGATAVAADAEASQWAARTFGEFGLEIQDRFSREAIVAFARLRAREFLRSQGTSDEQSPRALAAEFYRYAVASDYPDELASWPSIDDHFEMLDSGVIYGSVVDIMPGLIAELEALCE
jgi:O-acetyl-ADP-ribose deacetylase